MERCEWDGLVEGNLPSAWPSEASWSALVAALLMSSWVYSVPGEYLDT